MDTVEFSPGVAKCLLSDDDSPCHRHIRMTTESMAANAPHRATTAVHYLLSSRKTFLQARPAVKGIFNWVPSEKGE